MKRLWIAGTMLLTLSLMSLLLPAWMPVHAVNTTATAVQIHPSQMAARHPLLVLIEYDPWRMVIGSDSPTVALYDDGLVIFVRDNAEGRPEYASVKLRGDELTSLRRVLNIGDDFFALKAYYETVMKTDQPTNVIVAWDKQGQGKRVSVYGDLRRDNEARRLAPAPFVNLFDKAVNYTHPDAKTWLPEKFEVIVWEYKTSGATPWPKDWPDLNHPTTIKRDQVYSIYIESSKLTAFRKLAENATAFLINGKTWTFSLRFPFPQEEVWQEMKTQPAGDVTTTPGAKD